MRYSQNDHAPECATDKQCSAKRQVIKKPFVCWPVRGQPVETRSPQFAHPGIVTRRTALRESAYLRRTKYILPTTAIDFSCRSADLVAVQTFLPASAPEWAVSPFRVWAEADMVAERTNNTTEIRAWMIVADLPPGATPGQWLDDASSILTTALADTHAVAEMAIHAPHSGIPHAHVLVSARDFGPRGFEGFSCARYPLLSQTLHAAWRNWLDD